MIKVFNYTNFLFIDFQEGYNRNNPEHRYIFSCLLVTCADLSDYTKVSLFIIALICYNDICSCLVKINIFIR
jgi:hypothetical protein